jgi:hypothetical protein
LYFAVALCVFTVGPVSADALLGNVTIVGANGKKEVFPIVSGDEISYPDRALVRITGGTFVAEKGSKLSVAEDGRLINLRIDSGTVHFRIQPEKAVISFVTKDGSLATPEVVKASQSFIQGTVQVTPDGTVVELSDGELALATDEGPVTVEAGDRVRVVAQSVVDDNALAQSDPETAPPASDVEYSTEGYEAEATPPPAEGSSSVVGPVVFGTIAAGAIAGAVIAASTGGNGGGDGVGSPFE